MHPCFPCSNKIPVLDYFKIYLLVKRLGHCKSGRSGSLLDWPMAFISCRINVDNIMVEVWMIRRSCLVDRKTEIEEMKCVLLFYNSPILWELTGEGFPL